MSEGGASGGGGLGALVGVKSLVDLFYKGGRQEGTPTGVHPSSGRWYGEPPNVEIRSPATPALTAAAFANLPTGRGGFAGRPLYNLPGSSGAPTPQGQQGGGSAQQPPSDWRDYVELAGRLGLELYQRVQQSRAAQAARRAQLRFLASLQGRFSMPYPVTYFSGTPMGSMAPWGLDYASANEGAGFNWGGFLGGAANAVGSIINAFGQRDEGALAPYGDPWGPNILYPQSERANAAINASMAGGCGSPFVAGGSALRPSTFAMSNPASGRLTWFRPAGRPLLWSADFTAARRVRKLAGRARRRVGGR